MLIQPITNLNNYNKYQVKPCNTGKFFSTVPTACDVFTPSLTFKGIKEFREALRGDDAEALRHEIEVNGVDVNTRMGDEYNTPAIVYVSIHNRINCFRELRRHPELDMYAKDNRGWFCFLAACFYGYKDIVQDLVNDNDYNINMKNCATGLHEACFCNNESIVDIILQRPDVDLSLRDATGDTAMDNILKYSGGNPLIVEKLQAYVPGVDRRKNPKKIDINKIALNSAIWTEKEKQNIEKLIEENKYAEIVKLLEEKGVKLNEEYEQFRKQMTALKEETEESVRESITAQIRKEEKEKANKVIENQKADLAKQQEELEQEKQTLDNMIKTYESLHADDLRYDRETLASGLMSVYGINPPEKLPENLNFGEQVVFVMNVLVPRQNKLTDINDDTPETITKAVQDDSEKISNEGLKFLERIIDLSKDECNENDLISAIKSVKGNYGVFDMGKVSLFIRTLSWGNNTIQSSIKKVQKLAV